MDELNGHCGNCVLLNKELNLLQRKISLLNLEIDKLKTDSKPNENSIDNLNCHTELFDNVSETEIDRESSSSKTSSRVSASYNPNLTLNLSPNDKLNVFSFDQVNQEIVEPCTVLPGQPFENVNCLELDKSTIFTKKFQNRHVAYYGDFPYKYEGSVHKPNPIKSNPNLVTILNNVKLVIPSISFNSVLITKYPNGNFHLPYHSDNEESICEDSAIITISLGQSRVIKFRPKSNHDSELSINLSHGQVFTMSKKSQQFFEHCIPKDFTRQPRISITLRLIKPPGNISTQDICDVLLGLGNSQSVASNPTDHFTTESHREGKPDNETGTQIPTSSAPAADTRPQPQQRTSTLYISSSMFRHLDPEKLSSNSQESFVFFYPGASAGQMLLRFRNDPKLRNINLSSVKRVMLLTGSNNVDCIAGDQSGRMYHQTTLELTNLIEFLKSLVPSASINIINVLPRKCYGRNIAVNQINAYLFDFSKQCENVNFVNTEADRCLFTTKEGFRKSYYFVPDSNRIYDNVHLNHAGIVRLAKHLKFTAHNT